MHGIYIISFQIELYLITFPYQLLETLSLVLMLTMNNCTMNLFFLTINYRLSERVGDKRRSTSGPVSRCSEETICGVARSICHQFDPCRERLTMIITSTHTQDSHQRKTTFGGRVHFTLWGFLNGMNLLYACMGMN